MNEIIEEMVVQHGFKFIAGPHQNYLTGYFATFYCPLTEEADHDDWGFSGHGATLIEAVQQARTLALGQPVVHTRPTDFI